VVLVGLPGSGKTVAGRQVAMQLGAKFMDIDTAVERSAGLSVREIFATRGEAAFRALEASAARSALEEPAQIISPGGGWVAQPGNLAALAGRGIAVWLAVEPAVAAERTSVTGTRPLLDGPDPLGRMQALLAERLAHYQRADVTVNTTDQSVEQVALAVATLARNLAGW
jgi:shikimate kinase